MKSILTLIAVFFSLSLWAFVNPVEQGFALDDADALEYGFPHLIVVDSVEVITSLFSEPLVRIIGSANDQSFDLTRKIERTGPSVNGMIQVKARFWEHSIGGEFCDESIDKEITINFLVAKKSLRTSHYELKASRFFTADLCHDSPTVREFSYSLMK